MDIQLPALFNLLVIKPLAILVVVFVVALLIRKTSAAHQHFWLALGIFSVLLLPFMHWFFPVIEWPIVVDSDARLSTWVLGLGQPALPLDGGFWLIILFSIYLAIALWLLFYLALGILQITLDTRGMKPCIDTEWLAELNELTYKLDIDKPVKLVMSEQVSSPYMWGFIKPVIVLPMSAGSWSRESKSLVLTHELAHVLRNDWVTSIGVRICCALFWFLPPLWLAASRLHQFAELACDDYVYRLQGKHTAYAEALLHLSCARGSHQSSDPVLSLARRSPIFLRIQALLDRHRQRYPVSHRIGQYWGLTLVVVLLPLACIRAVPAHTEATGRELLINTPTLEACAPGESAPTSAECFTWDSGMGLRVQPELPTIETGFRYDTFKPGESDAASAMESTPIIFVPPTIDVKP